MTEISITTLNGVGPKLAERLAQLRIHSVHDLLFHLPHRYEDRTKITLISALKPGDHVLIEGRVISAHILGTRQYLRCVLQDDTHRSIDLIFYHFTKSHETRLKNAVGKIRCFGSVRRGFSGHLEMTHPEYAFIEHIVDESDLSLSPHLSPVYPTTKGLSQIQLRKLMQQALTLLSTDHLFEELLPQEINAQLDFLSLRDALHTVHFPKNDMDSAALLAGRHPVQQRLIFEELLAHQTNLQSVRHALAHQSAFAMPASDTIVKKFLTQLSFDLTVAQKRVCAEISDDLSKSTPMLRLLQGDVGSGKTVVACIAALQAIEAGYQVAFMAPTEILSAQHYRTFSKWFSLLNISVAFLTSELTAREHQIICTQIAAGEVALVIGTHALFQHAVEFKNLALLIVDEQHRFGVNQRLALTQKALKTGCFPHQLTMTATPIPRTLAMTLYADLALSVIDELPPNRKSITTALVASDRRDELMVRVRAHAASKKQVYWVCTLIDESDVLQCRAAETTAALLQEALPGLRVGLVHGRLKSEIKNCVMNAFTAGEIDLLVATTVVEVGVDVPNASLMIIENPERLGLAQLHQLRGRVGRGADASFCVLLYQHPLSDIARQRLALMRETQDGFVLAEQDLQMRGPGDVLGPRQSGLVQMRLADLVRDQYLLPKVQEAAHLLLEQYPDVITLLGERWLRREVEYLKV